MDGFNSITGRHWLAVVGFTVLTIVSATLLSVMELSADPMILLCAPVLVAPLFLPRWACWMMTGVLAVAALWAVHAVAGDVTSSARTTAVLSVMLIIQTDVVRRVVANRERHERDLCESEKRFHSVFDCSNDALFIFEPDSNQALDANATAQQLTGLDKNELLGVSVSDLFVADEADDIQTMIEAMSKTCTVFSKEGYYLKETDGQRLALSVSVTPIHINPKTLSLVVARDITARKQAEEHLRGVNDRLSKALADLRESQHQLVQQERLRTVGLMASGVAHDLNNYLVPIVSYAELLLHGDELPDRARKDLEVIVAAAQDTSNVVRRLQDFSRCQKTAPPAESVDLAEVVKPIPDLTRPKWRDESRVNGREIKFELQSQAVPPVYGHAADLRQVLINLVFNAVEAMPTGGRLTLRLKPGEKSAVIEVEDTGAGMSADQRKQCLDPFFSTRNNGCGLGLSISNAIVESHGGRIAIETVEGMGSLFRITLPAVEGCASPQLAPAAFEPSSSLRVLYVDDEEVVRSSIDALMSAMGHQVDLAENGAAALAMLGNNDSYDVVITDLGMPGMDGRQLTQAVKNRNPSLPVIMISGWALTIDEIDPSERPDWILQKPVTLANLDNAFSQISTLRRTRTVQCVPDSRAVSEITI